MPRIEAADGALDGVAGDGAIRFHGVPFARQPLGAGRFAHPLPPEPWAGVRDARAAAPAPLQPRVSGLGIRGAAHSSEDCLYLNVFTPACDGARRPVIVWFFGGGFVNGDAADPLYDGGRLAAFEGVVVVTANYRLGVLGFCAIRDANCGLADQVAVLEWVARNAERFGGDPGNVTIAGESAGAMSVCNLLAAPRAAGRFHRAIAQSGAADNVSSSAQAAEAAHAFLELLAFIPESAPSAALIIVQSHAIARAFRLGQPMPFRPWVDGALLPEPPIAAASRSRVPLIIGTNRDEQRLYVRATRKLDDRRLDELVRRRLERRVADVARAHARVLEHYLHERPMSVLNPNAGIIADIDTELAFTRPMLAYARARAHAGNAPTWIYRFDRPSPALRGWLGACHAIEVPYLFGTTDLAGTAKFVGAGADADRLSRTMMRHWAHFARYGRPPDEWPAFDADDPRALHLDQEVRVAALADDATHRLWDELLGA